MLGPEVTTFLSGLSKETKHLQLNMVSAIYERESVEAQKRKMVSNQQNRVKVQEGCLE